MATLPVAGMKPACPLSRMPQGFLATWQVGFTSQPKTKERSTDHEPHTGSQ